MPDGSSNDWEPPSSDASDSAAEQPSADEPSPDELLSEPASPTSGGGGGGGPTEEAPSIDRAFETLKTLVQRSLDGQVVWTYLAMFAGWMMLAGLFGGGAVAAMIGTGLLGSAEPDVAMPMVLALSGGAMLVVFFALVTWQTILVGLQRPMYNLMFRDTNAYDGIGEVFNEATSRFFPILGVTIAIGSIIYGGGLVGAGTIAMVSGFGVTGWEPSIALFGLYFLAWLLLALATGFYFGPATYFVATRNLGVVESLTKSFGFVQNHLMEHLVAWVVFFGATLALGCVSSSFAIVPLLGNLAQFVVSAFAALAGVMYWASFYMMLEDEADPNRNIIW